MKKALVVSCLFPPRGGVGVLRIAKFCKYLPEHGWQPVVLAADAPEGAWRDEGLLAEVEASSVIVRVPRPPDGSKQAFPEESIRWRKPALAQALRLIREEGAAAIFSSGDPVVNHLVAGEAARRSGHPWLADFRDEWAVNPEFIRSVSQRARANRWERDILNKADRVVSVTAPVVEMLARKGGGPAEKYSLIPNGYDGADLSTLPPAPARRDRFTITFTGHLPNPADLLPVLNALRLLLSLRLARANELVLRLVGDFEHIRYDEAMGLSGLVQKIPPGAHRAALAWQQDSDLLLSVNDALRGRYAVSVKLYEYMASGRPVLAVAPAGSVIADYVARSRTGRAADPGRPEDIADAIAYFFARWKRGENSVEPDRAFLEPFDRRRTAGQLARLLDSLAGAEPV